MKIEILGTGCAKCKAQEEIIKEALSKIGGFHSIEKVEDIMKIMEYNVMSTPAIVIDEEIAIKGRVPSKKEVLELLS